MIWQRRQTENDWCGKIAWHPWCHSTLFQVLTEAPPIVKRRAATGHPNLRHQTSPASPRSCCHHQRARMPAGRRRCQRKWAREAWRHSHLLPARARRWRSPRRLSWGWTAPPTCWMSPPVKTWLPAAVCGGAVSFSRKKRSSGACWSCSPWQVVTRCWGDLRCRMYYPVLCFYLLYVIFSCP